MGGLLGRQTHRGRRAQVHPPRRQRRCSPPASGASSPAGETPDIFYFGGNMELRGYPYLSFVGTRGLLRQPRAALPDHRRHGDADRHPRPGARHALRRRRGRPSSAGSAFDVLHQRPGHLLRARPRLRRAGRRASASSTAAPPTASGSSSSSSATRCTSTGRSSPTSRSRPRAGSSTSGSGTTSSPMLGCAGTSETARARAAHPQTPRSAPRRERRCARRFVPPDVSAVLARRRRPLLRDSCLVAFLRVPWLLFGPRFW